MMDITDMNIDDLRKVLEVLESGAKTYEEILSLHGCCNRYIKEWVFLEDAKSLLVNFLLEKILVDRKQLEHSAKQLHRDIDLFWEKFQQAKSQNPMNLEDGFNGFIAGYELRNKELLLGSVVKEVKPQLLDIAEMPNCSAEVKDGLHSVSEGKIFWTENNKVTCCEHGACNCVNKERTIWRCLTCHEGAYVPKIEG